MATEALDTEVVVQYLTDLVMFRYYKVTGAPLSGNFLVESIEPVQGITAEIATETKKLLTAYMAAAAGGV